MFQPRFTITAAVTRALMEIEAVRQVILDLPLDVGVLRSLRESARLLSTHYSTQIEGNRLTQVQVRETLQGAHFPGRERDEREVRFYYKAQDTVERLGRSPGKITEKDIRTIHGLVMYGRAVTSRYRDAQNVIRDSGSRRIVYLPPDAKDVAILMRDLVRWVNGGLKAETWPAPLIAALSHYQFATIHPYYDGNGRTARLLTTLILHKTGYGLKGIYSLEEYYAKHLPDYYNALAIGASHNYYLGRKEADVTPFVEYFCVGMAEAFAAVRVQATKAAAGGRSDRSPVLRELDPRQRKLLDLFAQLGVVTTAEMAAYLGLSPRTVADLCRNWIADGFLLFHNASRKARCYQLGTRYSSLIDQ